MTSTLAAVVLLGGMIGQSPSKLPLVPGVYSIRPAAAVENCVVVRAEEPKPEVALLVLPCAQSPHSLWGISDSPLRVGFALVDHAGPNRQRWFWTPRLDTNSGDGPVVLALKVRGELQLWQLVPAGTGRFRMRTASQHCLTFQAGLTPSIGVAACDSKTPDSQVWLLKLTGPA